MGFFKRIRRLWELSANEEGVILRKNPNVGMSVSPELIQRVEFIMPNRTEEILRANPSASLDDVIQK